MRGIEFKAQRVEDKRWVYGSYTCMQEDNKNNPFRQTHYKTYHRIWQYEPGDWNMGGYAGYEVTPESVCEFTGLKDKNGEKIFEGDKFQFYEHEDYYMPSLTAFVKYENGCFGFDRMDIKNKLSFYPFAAFVDLQKDFLMHIEIVGNIHDKIK